MASTNQIEQLIGVYDANGSILGEISYWVGARLGRRHCALCEITHGVFREKQAWRECQAGLTEPFEALHLDELSPELSAIVGSKAPCVVALRSDGSSEIVIDSAQLEDCHGEPARLIELIEALT